MNLKLLLLPLALMCLAASAEESRRLGSSFTFFHDIMAQVTPFLSAIGPDAMWALARFDGQAFIDAVVRAYVPNHNGGRALDDATKRSLSTADLRAKHGNGDVVTNMDNLEDWLNDQEWASFKSNIGKHEERSRKNVDIEYVKAGDGDKVIVLSNGNSEPIYKYDEIIYELVQEGYTVYALDHRGQGRSTRLVGSSKEDHFKNHVEHSDDYAADFGQFVELVKKEVGNKKMFLTCHSMGCAVAFAYLMNEFNAGKDTSFYAVTAFAPLVKADTDPFPYPIAVAIGAVMQFLGLETAYAPTKEGDFADNYGDDQFAGSTTQSVLRWTRHRDRCARYENQRIGTDNHYGLCLGGVTGGKAKEFFDLYESFKAFMEADDKKLSTPTLIQMAGDPTGSDGLVLNPDTTEFVKKSLHSSKVTNYKNSRHHIWTEIDDIRNPAIREALKFFSDNSATKAPQCTHKKVCHRWQTKKWWEFWRPARWCADERDEFTCA